MLEAEDSQIAITGYFCLCRYAWTCHHCQCVFPLDKEIVYEHIQSCQASCALVQLSNFDKIPMNNTTLPPLLYLNEYICK